MNRFAVLVALSILILNACSEFHTRTSTVSRAVLPPVIDAGRGGIHGLLAELYGMRDLSPELLQKALESREREYDDYPSGRNRLRFALLLAAGDESIRDYSRAREVLADINPLLHDPAEEALASILQQFLEEQETANQAVSVLSKQVKGQRSRIRELEQQQRALTTIEQSIKQREKGDEEPE